MNRSPFRTLFVLALIIGIPACGGQGIGPSPLPTVKITYPVVVTTFLDENGNGILDPSEGTRIPNIEVIVGGVKGTTAAGTGQATISAPEGVQSVEVTAASVPPFYRPPASPSTTGVPSNGPIMVPITLPRGSNRANVYMAFGDSITNGEPEVGDGNGYRRILESMLRAHFGAAEVVNEGVDATQSNFGAQRIGSSLASVQPAFTLILYGTNDWNDTACDIERLPCFTTSSFRFMVQQIKRTGGHAFLGTILPPNVGFDGRVPPSRNDWVNIQNDYLRQVAEDEGAVVVELNGAFQKQPPPLSSLFVDHLHPTAPGYQIMAQTWFDAITKAYGKTLSVN